MNTRSLTTLIAATFLLATGCAHRTTAKTKAPTFTASTGSIQLSDDIAHVCMIQFNDVDKAPKFDFDKSGLVYADRAVLDQVATCITTGPLKGRALTLIGHADPRGEGEYNMVLGAQRAQSAWAYLTQHGVDKGKLSSSSRGKLDATGTDSESWEKDRRVDISLR